LEPANTSALANMANLAQRQGDHTREAELRERLERQQQTDPFFHFVQAEGYEQAGDYPHAIEHYERAIHLDSDEPRFYGALAHAYELAGDNRHAIRALTHAAWLSDDASRADYQSKVDALRKR
jgi:tetratricopeptide (TPR) repeat protein